MRDILARNPKQIVKERNVLGKRYRIRVPVLAIRANTGEKGLILLRQGSVLTVSGYGNDERLVTVRWNGTELLVFANDVRERGTVIPD
jgi:hypothetical protein